MNHPFNVETDRTSEMETVRQVKRLSLESIHKIIRKRSRVETVYEIISDPDSCSDFHSLAH